MGLIWSLIVGAIIGAIAGAITNRGAAMGWIANIVAGLIGAWIGQGLLGTWGSFVSWHGIDTIDHWRNYFSSDCFISCWSNQ